MATYLIVQWLKALLLPPLSLFWLLLSSIVLIRKGYQQAWKLVLISISGLIICSIPLFNLLLFSAMEVHPALDRKAIQQSNAGAIVLLGGGAHRSAPEYNGENISRYTLERMQYAAELYSQTGLPILITGGASYDGFQGEGKTMARVLKHQFKIEAQWVDDTAVNTGDNAINSARILKSAGIKKILLVTHAMHMPRAENIFLQQKLDVVPAPTGFMGDFKNDSIFLLLKPSAEAWSRSYQAFHELFGRIWYFMRY